tara:strand:+ start:652 stop:825 length:174 start_codon:yes stop_codon:yes gene_type:complete
MGGLIFVLVIVITAYLGRYALAEGRKLEENKNGGRSENDPVTLWNKHKRRKHNKNGR